MNYTTIPSEDYNKLLNNSELFKDDFNKNATVLYHRSFFSGPSGYPYNEYKIVTDSLIIESLNKDLYDTQQELYKLIGKLNELENKVSNKKWYQFIKVIHWPNYK